MVTTNLNLHGIPQGRESDQFHGRSHQQPHFQQAGALFRGDFNFADDAGSADSQGSQRLRLAGHGSSQGGIEGFDQDGLSQLMAKSKPGIADLANHVDVFADQADLLFLAKAQLAQAM
jgi:hypothetical protein